MSTSIGDLVRPNIHGTFHSDVQLGNFFNKPENLQLARSYIFTDSDRGIELGSVQILWKFCEAYAIGNAPNRFTVLANYGHGKSHFAVAVANYFSMALESREYLAVRESLSHAIGNQPLLGRFTSFKQSKRPFFVVVLQGDKIQDLSSSFYQALETGLAINPATQDVRPPFWFDSAKIFLKRAQHEHSGVADEFLRQYDLDLVTLIENVDQRQQSAFGPSRELCHHIYGFYPSFEGTTSLGDMVEWAADTLCGADGPFGGVLILFDEFSTFVQMYSTNSHSGAPLQDLLNGVENRRGRVAFVALAQRDLETLTRASIADQTTVNDVVKELSRLTEKYELKSVLEEVLDSYLHQDEGYWPHMLDDRTFRAELVRAGATTRKLFAKRYDEDLNWPPETYRDIVVEGCFPLHPATTALFSTINFSATAQPRSVLQFAFKSLEDRASVPALDEGKVSWTLPIELVDYFVEMLTDRHRDDYQAALGNIDKFANPEFVPVLKAVLLILAGDVPTKVYGPAQAISEFSGVPTKRVKEILEELTNRYILRHEPADNRYGFWGASGPARVEKPLLEKLQNVKLSSPGIQKVIERLHGVGSLVSVSANLTWGSPSDWTAEQILLTRAQLTGDYLEQIFKMVVARPAEPIKSRGLVAWLLVDSEDDLQWIRDQVPHLIDDALAKVGFSELPVVLMRPRHPNSDAMRLASRIHALLLFTPVERQDVGIDAYTTLLNAEVTQLKRIVESMQTSCDPIVPQAFRGMPDLSHTLSIETLVEHLFTRAFQKGPRQFFTNYRSNSSRFNDAVKLVARYLADDALSEHYANLRSANPVAHDLVDKYLSSLGKWRMLGPTWDIRVPNADSPIAYGWEFLDQHIPGGSASVRLREKMTTLLNAPFGYDASTVSLLFAAWYGYHRFELNLSVDGIRRSILDVMNDRKNELRKPSELLAELDRASLSRRDASDLEDSTRAVVERVSRGEAASQATVANDIVELENAMGLYTIEIERRHEISKAHARLKEQLSQAQSYDSAASKILRDAGQGSDLRKVLEALDSARELADPPRLVQITTPAPNQMASTLQQFANTRVFTDIAANQTLRVLSEYEDRAKRLRSLDGLLKQHKMSALADHVEKTLKQLAQARLALEQEEAAKRHDEQLRSVLESIHVSSATNLADCRRYFELLRDEIPKTKEVTDELASKRAAIQGAISSNLRFAQDVASRVDTAVSTTQLTRIRDDILRRQIMFEGTLEKTGLVEALDRTTEIEQLFAEVEQLNTEPVESPAVEERVIGRLGELLTEQADHLSQAQFQAIKGIENEVRLAAQTKVHRSKEWLVANERDFERGENFPRLQDILRHPPAFLPPDEFSRLDSLRMRVTQALEQHAEQQVEYFFKQIGDPQKQRDLIAKLAELIGSAHPS